MIKALFETPGICAISVPRSDSQRKSMVELKETREINSFGYSSKGNVFYGCEKLLETSSKRPNNTEY